VENTEQVKISTANPTMDKGFTAGAYFNDLTRTGSNGWHGSLFEFWSGNILRTRNPFDAVDANAPRFVYNQFGATAGGAIVPFKTFIFGSWEGKYERGDQTMLSTVPTAAAALGNFSGIPGLTIYSPTSGTALGTSRTPFGGGVIPGASINRTSAAIARFIPAPNLPGFVNNLVTNSPYENDHQKFDGRIDQHFGMNTNLFMRYGYSNLHELNGSPLGPVIGAGLRDRLLGHNAAIGFTHDFNHNLITELRFGYNRYDQKLATTNNEAALGAALGFSNFNNTLASITVPGLPGIGAPAYAPEHPIDNTFNWVWSWSLRTNMNNFKWGVDIRRLRSDGFVDTAIGSQFGPNGSAFFGPGATLLNNGAPLSQYAQFYNSYAAFLLGAPSQAGTATFLMNPSFRQTQSGLWVGDTIQVMRRITIDLGLRYEVYSPVEPSHSGGAAFYNPANNTFSFAGIDNVGMHSQRYDLDNIAPRIGFALHADSRTVLRGGYGIQYFQLPFMFSGVTAPMFGSVNGVQGTFGTATIPGGFQATLTGPTAPTTLVNGSAATGNIPVSALPHQSDSSYVQTFNLQVERDFYYGTVLSVGYVGALDRHLLGITQLNAARPGTGVAGLPFASFGRTGSVLSYENDLNSNYNSLQVSLTKRFSQGIAFAGSYTWAKALGYTSANNMILDPFNRRANYGPLDWDRQHVLSISHVWELPFGRHGSNIMSSILGGWQLNGIFSWVTGTPLTLTADPVLCNCPGNTVLANANGPVTTTGNYGFGQPFIQGTFNTPTGSTIGNLGRGAIRGPDYTNYDMSLFKNFRFRDRFNFQLRGEAYNLANTPRLMNPVTNINAPDFGQINNTMNGAFGRQVNVALRILF